MNIVVYSEDPEYIKVASSYFPNEKIVAVSTSDTKYADELHVVDKMDEEAIAKYLASLKPDLLITGSTKRDKVVGAYAAGLLKYPILPDVIEISGNKAKRVVYSGMGIAELEFNTPIVVSISKKNVEAKERQTQKKNVNLEEGKVKKIEVKQKGGEGVDLSSAQIIVSVGRGIGSKENIKFADELARAIGGALGGSRPITADLGWLPEDRQIGLSGLKVKPKVYFALGISGQPQHLAGIKDSKIIVAVNTDKNAPIVENADYIVVGDVIKFCQEMVKKVGKK
ncbi:electron transfer flavoprotein subunit alpha/FixB family protein [Sulfolobus acidocaldarius]|uniref:Electron transfer flavoprotein n=4 Tax=Sulfolobus acidocaldarius TaxID=2285 RepID=Q4JBX2_SULAC|nr:electron transfer flavoprotein subunit alpha/FixB family protein [Sulfolobus acidocaldarius]AAY79707.1 electron transfer flavoprotein [Sulfolobus acidocaldarius DSM 639]AGE70266.1 electron transfer flavoprotein alpha subunit [Sulfolobus acidocaldarius N8]AGE72541.1 electron transfer flavoprotein alpha subunit [Sulfolobus acidocaldarius Ron12/I]ALU29332.1 electron transfer flavoprotein subunit alpha [Sulfolobus acidocaldarius]ALU32061.1 electron transfer flavoprotein subunit alpha [Sulfolobu